MKKTVILTGMLLALTASIASAQVNLAWNNCIASGASAANKAFGCDTNDGAQVLVPSFISPGLTKFVGVQFVVDVQSASPTLPDYWRAGGGECRDQLMGVGAPAGLSALCTNPYAGGFTGGGGAFFSEFGSPNRMRMQLQFGRDTEVAINQGTQAYAARIDLSNAKTVEIDPGDPTCGGCDVPACLVLNVVEAYQTFGTLPQDVYILNSPATRQHVTWQGGAIGGVGCPGETPTRNATWGSVKSLYR